MTGDRGDDLAQRTLALVDIASESREEAAALAHVRGVMAATEVPLQLDTGAALVYAPEGATRFLAGHLDTVPAQGNRPGRIADGLVHGLGATDMKGGVAVMLALAAERPDLGYLFFSREELPVKESSLPEVLGASDDVRGAELVVMLEPTDGALEVGCLGNLNADLAFHGVAAHSARPWFGENAIHAAVHGLRRSTEAGERRVAFGDGVEYVEVLSLTGIRGGVARNVVPADCVAHVNFRYAPDRSATEAEDRLRELVGAHGELTIVSNAPAAPVPEDNAHVEALRAAGAGTPRAKQAWTPVAEFAQHGIPAINFGPGDPAFAHKADEQVRVDALVRCYEVLVAA
jgi:succinyl-diaminopimelate desuccinylase